MANRPRRHHYVPSFYLAGFTASGSAEDRLFVFDQGQIRSWPSTPENAGHKRDFYAVDLGPDVDPACFESEVLARLEAEFSRVIRRSIENESLPAGCDMDVLLNFVAVMATRTPRIRRLVGQVTDLVIKATMQSVVASPESWQKFRDHLREAGLQIGEDEFEQMRELIVSGEYEVDLDRTSARTVNSILTATYWEIGRRIVEFEQGGEARAEYGGATLARLSQDLRAKHGRGFSERNLRQMRLFYAGWDICQTPSGNFQAWAVVPNVQGGTETEIRQTLSAKLQNSEIRQISSAISVASGNAPSGRARMDRTGTTPAADSSRYGSEHSDLIGVFPLSWSHYVKLMSVEQPHARAFYEAEAIRGGWSVRQLDRQISTQFFERTSQSKRREAMKPSRRWSRLAIRSRAIRWISTSESRTLVVCLRLNSTTSTASQTRWFWQIA